MRALEHLNKIISYIPLVDIHDRSVLPAIIAEFEEVLLDTTIPEAMKLQLKRLCKFTEHVSLNETDFEIGIKKLSQNVMRLITSLERKSDSEVNESILIDNTDTTDTLQSITSSNEITGFRKKFASLQKQVLDDFEGYLLSFEKGDEKAKQAIKRILHTWKGEFGVLELPQYSALIHQIEETIEKSSISTDQLFFFKDFLANQFSLIGSGECAQISDDIYNKLSLQPANQANPKSEDISIADSCEHHLPPLEEIDHSLLCDFIVESRDHIHTAESLLLNLESDPSNKENLNSIFRACHTIKGVASFINLTDLGELAHAMENVMDKCRKGELVLSVEQVDLLILALDCLKELISVIEQFMGGAQYVLPKTYRTVMSKLKMASQPSMESPKDTETTADTNSDSPDLFADQNTINQQPQPSVNVLVEENNVSLPTEKENAVSPSQAKQFSNLEETIRVPVHRLDQLIDAIGEAVIAQSMISADQTVRSSSSQALISKIAQTGMIMRQIQELSMSLRMVSLHATFQKMARLVRDLSKKSGKEIHFETDGDETELDKSVVENIGDPLIHMFRNAVDHGLESTEERISKGKPRFGTIKLRAYHKAGSVFIEISDDGKGLDRDLIFNKAVNKGLCKQDAKLTDLEIFQFIFLPGFSTAKTITDISGRGVGMDVVKRNIESLRGTIDIISEKDKGTTFSIRLPLTLAIIDGMIVKVENATYILPTLSIIETFAATSEKVISVFNKGEMIKVRENLIPLIYLSSTFGGASKRLNGQSKVAMIVEDMVGRKTALIVDEIIGQQQVVIKSLGIGIGAIAGISGGAIMSDGTVSLIIDVGGIIKSVYN